MVIFIFGNSDEAIDNAAVGSFQKLKRDFPDVSIEIVYPNADLVPMGDYQSIILIDVVAGINEITVFDQRAIGHFRLSPRSTTHDYDLGFQLKYLKKLGKIKKLKIIGLPQHKRISYSSFHSIVKKLVAQDMQGS
ncbi:MAG: hypothetical protein UW73_C0011G0024 [Microgenomates group bacterium GW2011_GWB1_44_8]|nr:MAG: hypothetical protein UW73_C0011G0024 [Microgenomates group bacterium GW2011_GWB1_44_8]